ncbi:CaiB/BaiF CoA transferase family protein [Sulfurospirillum arcachonense]|uniref:CaiB/BaiF CoA transferase family protein n=1 Tax=Sulfurospirillum arcachonense TaxID=57666 RepID=UPI00046AAC35|nr:CoA transferase [Sulfurospirillum arcachonense]
MSALTGIRVLDVSTVIASPFAAGLFADFGAEVIKIEMPKKGDPFRGLGPYHKGEGVRWASMGRNKKSVTLDLHFEEGKNIFLELVAKSDIIFENFRVGTLDKWGLDIETLKKFNPDIIVVRVTGYGQSGPYKNKAGFGTPANAFSGMTYITGHEDRPPVSPSFSLADYIAGLYAAMSAMMALYHRDALGGKGQEVDVSLYEGIFRMQEILVADYTLNSVIRERKPSLSGTSSPGGTFQTKDGKWIVLVCSTDRTFEYLTNAMNRRDLLEKFTLNKTRLENDVYINGLVNDWVMSLSYEELKTISDKEGVPVNLIYSIEDIMNDPHYKARQNIISMPHKSFGEIQMPGITPVFSETPGEVKWSGPELGEHTDEVLSSLLHKTQEQIASLKEAGII